ncbi:ImmA/IrrE family metallo-endopeptidase [Devosia sp.]|uniref:ImmA/IrrE family metallo-endopeptidase n=1 Tax=Devosia sp. TaxID=1871048 RepID=UPI003A9030A1
MRKFDKRAAKLRDILGLTNARRLDATELLERAAVSGLIIGHEEVEDASLPYDAAQWHAEPKKIIIRQSVMLRSVEDDPRPLFTVAHELAHAVLGHPTRNRRASGQLQFGRHIEQQEADADALAAALLAPMDLIVDLQPTSARVIAEEFGIPIWIAERRLVDYQKSPAYAGRRLLLIERETFDTGDYEAAMRAMARNAER